MAANEIRNAFQNRKSIDEVHRLKCRDMNLQLPYQLLCHSRPSRASSWSASAGPQDAAS
jgi:hypothetical protein